MFVNLDSKQTTQFTCTTSQNLNLACEPLISAECFAKVKRKGRELMWYPILKYDDDILHLLEEGVVDSFFPCSPYPSLLCRCHSSYAKFSFIGANVQ